jgi:uncharacterized protein (TIGR03435 family)
LVNPLFWDNVESSMRLILCFLLLAITPGSPQTAPTFEVATIKPTVSRSGVTGGCRGIDSKLAATDPRNSVPLGRCVVTAGRLSHLMSMAFGMSLQRISGFPEWDGPNRFDIEAKAENPSVATEQQLIAMFQKFLIDQFKLTLHRDSKEVPIFSLVVAKNGPKNLHESTEAGESMLPAGSSLVFKGYTMQRLAEFLGNMPSVERPVKDMTNLTGRYDFKLEVLGTTADSIENVKMAMLKWETIFSDVQGQLGLRFELAKGSIETLIIDHAELPSPQ